MIERIIRYSIQHKLVIGLGTLVLIALGIRAITRLPVDAVPDITNNQVQVITIAPTLATLEVEQFVSYPIEQALGNLPEVHELRSISRFGVSQVTIVFDDRFDTYLARQLVNERLQLVRNDLPPGVDQPYLAPLSTGLGEVYQYVIHPKPGYEGRYDAMQLREVQDWIIARQLMGTPGVAEINSFGGYLKQFEVAVDPVRLQGMGLGIGDILQALERNNANTGGAYIERGSSAYYIRGVGIAKGLDDIGRIVVATPEEGAPVRISDVATPRLGHAPRYGAMTRNGVGEVVGGIVMMLKGQNANDVVAAVKARLASIEKNLPEGLMIDPFLDRTALVGRAIGTVEKNLLEGALIVILVLVLFLGQLRAGLIVASVIPLAMLFALILMDLTGVTGNLMSLGAIDFGLIVDGAVIIVEAVLHRLHHGREHAVLSRKEMDGEVSTAASRMMNAATFGQFIILIVYIPILSLSGVEGKMFGPMAQTVAYAILGAIILSLTYVPVMSALFIKRRTGVEKPSFSDRMMAAVEAGYKPTLERVLSHRWPVVITALVLLAASVFGFLRMGGEFIPQLEEGDFAYHSILPQGSSLSASVANNKLVERKLMQFPEVKMVVGKTGTAEVPTDLMSPEQTDMLIMLKDKDEWTTTQDYWTLADSMLKALQTIPGVLFEINQPIQMRFNELMTGVRQDIAIKVFGPDLDSLLQYAERIAAIVQQVPGAGPPQVERVAGLPQITVRYDRDRMAMLGADIDELNGTVRAAFAGEPAGSIYENERRFDLVVRADTGARRSLEDVARLFVRGSSGQLMPLEQLAQVGYEDAPAQITHENAQRRIYVGVNARGRDVESLVADIEQRVNAQVKLPAGYYITFGGQYQNLVEAKARLAIAVPLALLLILGLLYFTFRSLPDALLIFSAVPLSAIGGVAALYLRDMPFSISAGVGFIALFGVAVLNGMVLISTFQQLAREGVDDVVERVRKGTVMRLRPVLMTASVASLGFLPMALSGSAGAEVQRPLATVVIGGLVSATLLTLVVLPVLYVLFIKARPLKAPAALVLLALLVPGLSHAQQSPTIPLDSALAMAFRNNGVLRAAELAVEQAEVAKGSAWNIDKTGFFVENEDVSPATPDGIFKMGLAQRIEFPTVYAARNQAAKARIGLADADLALAARDLERDVRLAWNALSQAVEEASVLRSLDSLVGELGRVAELRHATGEVPLVEKASALARRQQVAVQRERAERAVAIAQLELKRLLRTDDPLLPASPHPVEASLPDATITAHPLLDRAEGEVLLAHQLKRVEGNRALPDMQGRWFNQRIYGVSDEFRGYSLTIGLPIAFWDQRGRIKGASLQERIAREQADQQRADLSAAYGSVLTRAQQAREAWQAYEGPLAEQAAVIERGAATAYKAGEIGYVELTALITQSTDLRLGRIQSRASYAEALIQLDHFTGTLFPFTAQP
ncbi:MAG: CusA/CzcA family heavy metal efflux RND transporter [Flavobacteriales bacterium]|nr:MAG: CusA/CzcA family heavy metal efflux RND transporter [Flavobacteriales bacterium]